MPRFDRKQVLFSVVCIASGLALLGYVLSKPLRKPLGTDPEVYTAALALSGAFLGAGVALPFRRTWIGAIIGSIVLVGSLFLIDVIFFH